MPILSYLAARHNRLQAPSLMMSVVSSVVSSSYRTISVLRRSFTSSPGAAQRSYDPPERQIEKPSYFPYKTPRIEPRTDAERKEYTKKTARFPPELAEKRYAKLRENRLLGTGPHMRMKKKRPKATVDIPVNVPLDRREREKIHFEVQAGISNDRRAFFENDVDAEKGEVMDFGEVEMAESMPGLEVGRVVECRRWVE